MLLLTKEELKSHQYAKVRYICGKGILQTLAKNKNYRKVRDHCHCAGKYRGVAHSIYNLKFNVLNEIPVVFHNDSNYDYHFIIKQLPNKFRKNLNVSGKIQKIKRKNCHCFLEYESAKDNLIKIWEKFNETLLPEKEEFYSNLNLEDFVDLYDMNEKGVCKDFEIKYLGEYHGLYLKSDALPLADGFKNFRKRCLKNYNLDPAKFLLAPGLAW